VESLAKGGKEETKKKNKNLQKRGGEKKKVQKRINKKTSEAREWTYKRKISKNSLKGE